MSAHRGYTGSIVGLPSPTEKALESQTITLGVVLEVSVRWSWERRGLGLPSPIVSLIPPPCFSVIWQWKMVWLIIGFRSSLRKRLPD